MGEQVDGREWLSGEGPQHLWLCIEPEDGAPASARKRRLFVVALCGRLWNVFRDDRSRAAVEVAERYADGRASEVELVAARTAASRRDVLAERSRVPGAAGRPASKSAGKRQSRRTREAADNLARVQSLAARAAAEAAGADGVLVRGFHSASEAVQEAGEANVYSLHMALVHEIFGDRLRQAPVIRPVPIVFDAAWRTSDAVAIATGIYESRDFGAMPILADALQDAGCTSDDILNHLRDPHATHVRGCWALDLVLGKE